MAIIEVEELWFRYANSDDYALKGINLSIDEGEFVAIAGSTGCGKSTFLRCINGLIPSFYRGDYSGKVRVLGMDASSTPTSLISKHVGMVFQNPDNQLFSLTVEQDVAFALENLGVPRGKIAERVDEALRSVGIEELRKMSPFELSGGQKQRVAIASVLALKPKVLLLDEPTSSLDPMAAASLISLLGRLKEEMRITVVVVEHRLDLLAPYMTRLVVMGEGEVIDDGRPSEVFERAIEKSYAIQVPKVAALSYSLSKRLNGSTKVALTVEGLRSVLSRVMDA